MIQCNNKEKQFANQKHQTHARKQNHFHFRKLSLPESSHSDKTIFIFSYEQMEYDLV